MKDELEEFIQNNRDSFDRKTPDAAVLGRILGQMQQKEKSKPKGIVISFQAVRWAAAVLALIACGAAGFWMVQKRPELIVKTRIKSTGQQQFTKLKPDTFKQTNQAEATATETPRSESTTLVEQDLKLRKQALLTKLRVQRSNSAKKQVMFAGLSDMDSPASRIAAASGAYKLAGSGNDIVDALVETLNTDPNANVRLAALDGLNRFYRESYVRRKLLASLKKQQDPVVQIALINLLTHIRESGILEELEKMVSDDNTQKAVKDCAYSGIIRLHSS